MATVEARKNAKGEIIAYRIRVSRGYKLDGHHEKFYSMTWKPDKNMSEKEIQKELARQELLFEEKCNNGLQSTELKMTLAQFVPQYLEIAKIKLAPTTLEFYNMVINKHILPKLGRKRMQDIKPVHVQEFVSYLSNLDSHNGKGKIVAKTVRRYLTVLQSVFQQAYKLEIITSNPTKAEKLTLPREVQKDVVIFNKQEAAEMLKCLESEPLAFQTMIQLAIITGARRGELVALKFSDFDYDECKVTISRAAIKLKGEPVQIKPPKDYEVRTVTINPQCIELVKMLRKENEQRAKRLGTKWVGDEWLFTKWNGEICHPQTPTKQFSKFLEKNGLKHRKFHSLRHTSATLCLYGGVNIKQVQARLGHSELETTQKYLHNLAEADAEAANVLTNILNGEDRKTHEIA